MELKGKENHYPIHEELKNSTPFLSEIGNQNPFSVPEGYFVDLQEHIEEKVNESRRFNFSEFGKLLILKPQYSIAASFVILLLSFLTYNYLIKPSADIPDFYSESVDYEDIVKDNSIYIDNIEEYTIVQVLFDEAGSQNYHVLGTDEIVTEEGEVTFNMPGLTSDDIIDYLIDDNDIDIMYHL